MSYQLNSSVGVLLQEITLTVFDSWSLTRHAFLVIFHGLQTLCLFSVLEIFICTFLCKESEIKI